ncbi:MAG: hypothetical protein J5746_11175 [Victivallales bacterium]|nr:hypothetical protein [Victivallales bacterium]
MSLRKTHLVLLLLIAICIEAFAVPKVRVVSVQQGNSAFNIGNSVGRLEWQMENPDATPELVTLKLSSESGTPFIYSREIRLPAKSSVQGTAHLYLNDSGRYKVECLHRGKPIYKESPMLPVKSMHHFCIGIINDKYDLRGYSKVQKMKELPYRAAFSSFRAANAPEHWGYYGALSMLVLLGADFENYSTPQMSAIVDFVAMGGTLLIGMPETALKMKGTVLEQLLPFEPVSLRQTESYSNLARLFGVSPWKESQDFDEDGKQIARPVNVMLNVLPQKGCRPILSQNGTAYAYTRYFGRGKVIACIFNPFEICAMDERFILPVWKFIMYNSGYMPSNQAVYDTKKVNDTLQMLHGYSIPSAGFVGGLLLVYIIVVLCIMTVAFFTKHQTLGWLASCAFGIAITVFIMVRASGIADSKAVLSTANVSVSAWNGARGASQNNSLMLASKDVQAQARVSSEHVFLRPQQPPTFMVRSNMAQVGNWIAEEGQSAYLEKLSFQKMRPRSLLWLTSSEKAGQPLYEMPVLDMREEGLRLRDWKLPEELRSGRRALLVTSHGTRTLDISGGFVRDTAMTQHLEADTVLLSVSDYIAALPKKGPCLALVRPNPPGKECLLRPSPVNDESCGVYDYDIVMVQAEIACDEVPKVVSSDVIQMQVSQDSSLRTLYNDGEWMQVPTTNMTGGNLCVLFHVPPEYSVEAPAEVRLDLSVLVPGNDVKFEPVIKACNGKKLNYTSRKGSTYIFQTEGTKILSPIENNIEVILNMIRTQNNVGIVSGARTNYWKITELSATVVNSK